MRIGDGDWQPLPGANLQTQIDAAAQLEALCDGTDRVESTRELAERLAAGRPLRVKLGLDPTSPDLHLGHAVVLHKLQQFVEFGHDVTLVIGDFTARIGDPSGRNVLRPQLSDEAIDANLATYAAQAGKVLDLERIRVRRNSEWLGKLDFAAVVRLAAQTTGRPAAGPQRLLHAPREKARRSRCTSFSTRSRKRTTASRWRPTWSWAGAISCSI